MVTKKLMLPILAVIVGVAASAFTAPTFKGVKQTGITYVYVGPSMQTLSSRETASNYQKGSTTCTGSNNECAVILNQDFGNTPDFSNVTFDGSGFPEGGSAFVKNIQKH